VWRWGLVMCGGGSMSTPFGLLGQVAPQCPSGEHRVSQCSNSSPHCLQPSCTMVAQLHLRATGWRATMVQEGCRQWGQMLHKGCSCGRLPSSRAQSKMSTSGSASAASLPYLHTVCLCTC
jgi:hypothetical protein